MRTKLVPERVKKGLYGRILTQNGSFPPLKVTKMLVQVAKSVHEK